MTSYLAQMQCTECRKTMVPQFKKEYPHKLDGWSCDCGHSEKAILRERMFTRASAQTQDSSKA